MTSGDNVLRTTEHHTCQLDRRYSNIEVSWHICTAILHTLRDGTSLVIRTCSGCGGYFCQFYEITIHIRIFKIYSTLV